MRDYHFDALLRYAVLLFAWFPATNMWDSAAFVLWSPQSRYAMLAMLTGYREQLGGLLLACSVLLVALPGWNVLIPWRQIHHGRVVTVAAVSLMTSAAVWVAMAYATRGTDLDVARHTLLRTAVENVCLSLFACIVVNAEQRRAAGVVDSDFCGSNLMRLDDGGRCVPR